MSIVYRVVALALVVAGTNFWHGAIAAVMQAILVITVYLVGRDDGWGAFWQINGDAVVAGAERDAELLTRETD